MPLRLHRSLRLKVADLALASCENVACGPRASSCDYCSDVAVQQEVPDFRTDGFITEVADADCECARRRVESDAVAPVQFVQERLLPFRDCVLVHSASKRIPPL